MAQKTTVEGRFTYTKCAECERRIIIGINTNGLGKKETDDILTKFSGSKGIDYKYRCISCAKRLEAQENKRNLDSGVKATLAVMKKVYVCPICNPASHDGTYMTENKTAMESHLRTKHNNYEDTQKMLKHGGRKRGVNKTGMSDSWGY